MSATPMCNPKVAHYIPPYADLCNCGAVPRDRTAPQNEADVFRKPPDSAETPPAPTDANYVQVVEGSFRAHPFDAEDRGVLARWAEKIQNGGGDLRVTHDKSQHAITVLRYEATLASLSSLQAETADEVARLRGALWALADAMGRRALADANATNDDPSSWPAGQEWVELSSSSQATFRRIAYEAARIDRDSIVRLLCDEYGNAKPIIELRPPSTDPRP